MAKYLNLAGLQYWTNKIKALINVKADASAVYTKTESDTALGLKANAADVYSKGEVDTAVGAKANAADVYNKTEVDTAVGAKANAATTLTGYGITDAYTSEQTDAKIAAAISANNEEVNNSLGNVYTKEEVDAKVASVYVFKGSKATYADLPTEGNAVGHVYNIETADAEHGINAGDNVAWDGAKWDKLAGTITFDTSDLVSKEDVITNAEIDGLFVEA